MGFNPRLAPYSIAGEFFDVDPAADKEYQWFRFPVAGQFVGASGASDVAVATATNTVAAYITAYTGGTTLAGTCASFAAGSTWAADVIRTATKTAFGSTHIFAAGDTLGLKYDETTSGLLTDATFQIDYVLGYEQGPTPTAATGPAED